MGSVVRLPHHRHYSRPERNHPRIDERRHAPGEEVTLCGWFVIAYGLGLFACIAFALWSIGA